MVRWFKVGPAAVHLVITLIARGQKPSFGREVLHLLTSVPLARGHKSEISVLRVGGAFDDAASSSMDSPAVDVPQRCEAVP